MNGCPHPRPSPLSGPHEQLLPPSPPAIFPLSRLIFLFSSSWMPPSILRLFFFFCFFSAFFFAVFFFFFVLHLGSAEPQPYSPIHGEGAPRFHAPGPLFLSLSFSLSLSLSCTLRPNFRLLPTTFILESTAKTLQIRCTDCPSTLRHPW